jgi:tetratricopeptide (TPR) repeat protein
MELSPAVWTSAFRSDPRFAGVFAHPWHWGPLGAAGGYSPAGWAFVALLALGIASFAANRRAVRSWRCAVWLPFAALAAWQVRLIPFFAVVAAPIAATNLGEVVRAGANARPGRLLAIAGVLALLTLNWFSGLAGTVARDRTPAWAVYSDPTLERAAKGVVEWRHANGIPADAHVFAAHPDVGHYFAWHAPGERYFLDSRLTLFTEVADEFAAQSRAVALLPDDRAPSLPMDVAAILLYDSDAGRMTRALAQGRESVLRIDGAAVLLARPGSNTGTRFDADRAAFGGASELPIAWAGPERLAEPTSWWQVRGGRGRMGSWEADAATVYLRLLPLASSNSPALPLLAVRGARVGIEIDPNDPAAWMVLGGSYMLLGERTWEREAGAGLSPLESIRLIQATAALTQTVLLSPDSAPAHAALAGLCARQNVLDLAHRHAAAAARLVRRNGPPTGESAEAFGERAARAEAMAEAMLRSVQEAQNRFLVRTASLTGDPLARARTAAELGLKQQAIDLLLASHPDLYGAAGVGLLAELLLQTGQVQECRALLDRAELRRNPNALGNFSLARKPNPDGSRPPYQLHAYDWLDLCQCAAAGHYAGAQEAIGRLCERLAARAQTETLAVADAAAAVLAIEVGLGAPPAPILARLPNARERITIRATVTQTRSLAVTRGDLLTVAGVLDIERGDPKAATARFAEALGLYAAASGFAVSKPGEPLAVRYDKAIRGAR